ncbi:MAG: chitobiase/beta-hexosaminidase C-terminal domain-containing protein [Opitutales bacterium]|nr:chitobiase/beta-hexosaminidase C-terminal domain-containing protein [Opitutales bacterium]
MKTTGSSFSTSVLSGTNLISIRALFFAFVFLLSSLSGLRAAEVIWSESLRDGALPAGWTEESVLFPTVAGGYARFTEIDSVLTSPVFDGSAFKSFLLTFTVAKFGQGPDGPITVEYSIDGGMSWMPAGVSPVPTSATYLSAELLLGRFSETMQIRFTRPDSPSEKRLRDLVLTGLPDALPPTFGNVVLESRTSDSLGVSVSFDPVGAEDLGDYGFLISEMAIDPTVTTVVVGTGDPGASFEALIGGLSAGVIYLVQPFAEYEDGVALGDLAVFRTLTLTPVLTVDGPYEEDFGSFDSELSLPAGWSVAGPNVSYFGPWGSGASSGLRGDADVLGFQLTANGNSIEKILTLENGTGTALSAVTISYIGRAERLELTGRLPAYEVFVNGVEAPGLAYSTADGDGVGISATVGGLSVAPGETFTIVWRALYPSGVQGARQIGISAVSVERADGVFLSPVVITPESGTYFEPVEVELSTPDAGVAIHFTLDGTDPTEASPVYAAPFFVTETSEVRARAFPLEPTGDETLALVTSRSYVLPMEVPDLAALASAEVGGLYRITGEVVLTAAITFRNQAFVQDAAAGIMIDDFAGFLAARDNYELGDALTGLVGTLGEFGDMLQFVPTGVLPTVTGVGLLPVPIDLTLEQLYADFPTFRARLVRLTDVSFDDADGLASFASGQVYGISDSSGSGFFRTSFFSADTDYIGAPLPVGAGSLLVLPTSRTDGNFVTARFLADFDFPQVLSALDLFLAGFGITGEDADPFASLGGDGLTNVQKWVFGGHPLQGDLANLPFTGTIVDQDGLTYATLSVYLAVDATWDPVNTRFLLDGATIDILQADSDLSVFTSAEVFLLTGETSWTPAEEIPGGNWVRLQSALPLEEGPVFFRTAVTVP